MLFHFNSTMNSQYFLLTHHKPTLNGLPDITKMIDNERYDVRIHKCSSYFIIDVQNVVCLLVGFSEFDKIFPVA